MTLQKKNINKEDILVLGMMTMRVGLVSYTYFPLLIYILFRRYPPQPRICSAQPTVRPPQLTGHPSQPSQPASENRRKQWRQYYNRNKRRINRARMARSRQQGVRENDEDQQQQKTTKNNYEIKGIFK
ncbi:hypothetical protein K501DRAFT_307858 [Backusella circina FSU 941]|nr:hypothetical protein K501DRAFT_307858 [Backusella circina FSU 941]